MSQDNPKPSNIQHTVAQLNDAVSQQQMGLSEKVGALKATNFIKKLVTVTEIKMLAEIKESKEYKGLQLFSAEGKLVTVTSWEDFCKSLGHSREKVDQDILNLSTFGEDFLETSQRMGVGYRDLRKLRKLPDAEREVIINGEAVQAEDKDSLIDLIEEMSAKHVKTKQELQQQIDELKADNTAKDNVLSTKNKKIDELDTKLSLRQQPDQQYIVEQETEEHINKELAKAVAKVLSAVSEFNTGIITLKQQAQEVVPHLLPKIDQDLSYVYGRLADIALHEGIDIDLAEMITPSWAITDDTDDFQLETYTQADIDAKNNQANK